MDKIRFLEETIGKLKDIQKSFELDSNPYRGTNCPKHVIEKLLNAQCAIQDARRHLCKLARLEREE